MARYEKAKYELESVKVMRSSFKTRPSALGMSDPIWGPLIHIFVDEKKNWKG